MVMGLYPLCIHWFAVLAFRVRSSLNFFFFITMKKKLMDSCWQNGMRKHKCEKNDHTKYKIYIVRQNYLHLYEYK